MFSMNMFWRYVRWQRRNRLYTSSRAGYNFCMGCILQFLRRRKQLLVCSCSSPKPRCKGDVICCHYKHPWIRIVICPTLLFNIIQGYSISYTLCSKRIRTSIRLWLLGGLLWRIIFLSLAWLAWLITIIIPVNIMLWRVAHSPCWG